jgi:hypothetical protein
MQFVDAHSKVQQLPLVNKAWNRACHSPASWHSIRMIDWPRRPLTKSFRNSALKRLLPRLSRLEVLWCEDTTLYDFVLSSMINVCGPRLRELSLECTGDQLLTIAMGAPNLRSIKLDHPNSAQIMDAALGFCRQLRSIRVNDIPSEIGLYRIGTCCPFLERYYGHVDEKLMASLSSCAHLTDLDLYSGPADMTNGMATLLKSVGGSLRFIDFPCCDGSVVFPLIARHCKKLAKIRILHVSLVTDALVEEVLSNCGPTLEDIDLKAGCTDASLASAASHCPNLVTLDLTFNKSVTDAGLAVLAASCPNLRQLDLTCTNLSDASLLSLAEHSALRHVTVTDWMTTAGLKAVHARRAELGLRAITTTLSQF